MTAVDATSTGGGTTSAVAVLRLADLRKAFGATQALGGVSIEVLGGEVHGLVGHNGAGKSTVVKILTGYHTPDEGSMWLRGEEVTFPVRAAGRRGLAVVQQDRALVEDMSVRNNIAAATPARWSDWFMPTRRRHESRVSRRALEEFGIHAASETEFLEVLPESLRPVVAIVRAVCQVETFSEPGVLILDEPTASLTGPDAARVLDIVRRVARRGHGVVFISHRLTEVVQLCDRVTVLRNGKVVANLDPPELSKSRLVAAITGEATLGADVGTAEGQAAAPALPGSLAAREVVMKVSNVKSERLIDFDLEVKAGEVLVVTGLRDSGFEDLVPALLGRGGTEVGALSVFGHRLSRANPREMRRAGVAIIPRDRKRRGLWEGATLAENLTIADLSRFTGRFTRNVAGEAETSYANRILKEFNVFPPNPNATIEHLSGGNQQKVVFAREFGALEGQPMVVLAEEPVEAVDATTRRQIAGMLHSVRDEGGAAVVATDDSDFIIGLADRVVVIAEGAYVGELIGEQITELKLLEMCQTTAEPK